MPNTSVLRVSTASYQPISWKPVLHRLHRLHLLFVIAAVLMGTFVAPVSTPLQARADSVSITPDTNGDYVTFGGLTSNDVDSFVFTFSGTSSSPNFGVIDIMHHMRFYDSNHDLVGTYNSFWGVGAYRYHDGETFPYVYSPTGSSYNGSGIGSSYGFYDGYSVYQTFFKAQGAVTMEDWYIISNTTQNGSGILAATSAEAAHRTTYSLSSYWP
jgi:hypothetical protein